MASRKQQKSRDFLEKAKEGDRIFQIFNVDRPQDVTKGLIQRARQLNFGLLQVTENPMKDKIISWKLEEELLSPRKDFTCFPNGELKPTWVRTNSEFCMFIQKLKKCSEFAIDIECHNYRSQKGFIALIQIGTWEWGDFLLDPFTVRNEISTDLKSVLECTDVLKIGHALTNDVKWLQRDFDIFMVGAMDTQIMYDVLTGEKMVGLKPLALKLFQDLKGKFVDETLSDWRLRPGKGMSKDQEQYAASDVHVLLRVFDRLRFEMANNTAMMEQSAEETKYKLLQVSEDINKVPVPPNFTSLAEQELTAMVSRRKGPHASKIAKEISSMTPKSRFLFRCLIEWRFSIARIIDEKPHFAVSSEKLLSFAKMEVPDLSEIRKILSGCNRRIYDATKEKSLQSGIIHEILKTGGEYMEVLRSLECHNCLKTGHGPAWACPFPKNQENYKKYYAREENKKYKHERNRKNFLNLSAKFGEEVAASKKGMGFRPPL